MHTPPTAALPEDTLLWEVTTLQAVRLVGELAAENRGLIPPPVLERAGLDDSDLDDLLECATALWDAMKAHTGPGAPEGELGAADQLELALAYAREEADLGMPPADTTPVACLRLLAAHAPGGLSREQRALLRRETDLGDHELGALLDRAEHTLAEVMAELARGRAVDHAVIHAERHTRGT